MSLSYFIKSIFLICILSFLACNQFSRRIPPEESCDYARLGSVYAETNYRALTGYGLFEHDGMDSITIITGQIWDDNCSMYEQLLFQNIPFTVGDTTFLKYAHRGVIIQKPYYPTASYHLYDGHSPLRTYDLVQSQSINNWIVIDSIFPNKEAINCSFQVHVKDYVPDSIPNLGDPNRPDTLHFVNGIINAKLWP